MVHDFIVKEVSLHMVLIPLNNVLLKETRLLRTPHAQHMSLVIDLNTKRLYEDMVFFFSCFRLKI